MKAEKTWGEVKKLTASAAGAGDQFDFHADISVRRRLFAPDEMMKGAIPALATSSAGMRVDQTTRVSLTSSLPAME